MIQKYKILGYNKNTGILSIKINSIINIRINIDLDFPEYVPCYDYYFNDNKLYRLEDSNGEKQLILNNINYIKCYQYDYDKFQFENYGLVNDNAKLYKYFMDKYK